MTETEKKVAVPEGFMTGKFPLKKRAYGEEQPGIKVGRAALHRKHAFSAGTYRS